MKAKDYQNAVTAFKKTFCNLIILDLETIGENIFQLCQSIRKQNDLAIIIVLMEKPKIKIELSLFDCGVNDVVAGVQRTKKVLLKRLSAHLKNCRKTINPNGTIRLNTTIVDFSRHEVCCNGSVRRLPGILSDLLKYFVDNPNRVISREELLKSPIWSDSICSSANEGGKTFDVNMSKLRKIIEPDPAKPCIIQSVRGVGWKLSAEIAELIEKES